MAVVIKLNKTSRRDLMHLLAMEVTELYDNIQVNINFWSGKNGKPNVNVICNSLDLIIRVAQKEKLLLIAREKAKKIYHSGDFRTWSKLLSAQIANRYSRLHDADNINALKRIFKRSKLTTFDYVTLMIADLDIENHSVTNEELSKLPSSKIENYVRKVCNEIDKRIIEAILFHRITTREDFYRKVKTDVVNYINKVIRETGKVSIEK